MHGAPATSLGHQSHLFTHLTQPGILYFFTAEVTAHTEGILPGTAAPGDPRCPVQWRWRSYFPPLPIALSGQPSAFSRQLLACYLLLATCHSALIPRFVPADGGDGGGRTSVSPHWWYWWCWWCARLGWCSTVPSAQFPVPSTQTCHLLLATCHSLLIPHP
jgi:hypothetical protein